MDTQKNNATEILDFYYYIKSYFTDYKFDEFNTRLVKDLGLWANRDEKFNDKEPGWHIDRGILLIGVPGVGKDVIFRILRKYLSYLRSPYGYADRIVWEYATRFKDDKIGYKAFEDVLGNCYFQELARTDENTAGILTLSRESVQHFGNKVLIGSELINVRNNLFVTFGYQSHFSSNHNEEQLDELYGTRCVDRLREMCNYMVLGGTSKRGKVAPQFVTNKNVAAPPRARETTIDEHIENKAKLEAEYALYCEHNALSEQTALNYYLLKSYHCDLGTEDQMRDLMEKLSQDYVEPVISGSRSTKAIQKADVVWERTKTVVVLRFYQKLKAAGAKSIFGIVDAPVNALSNNIVSGNKTQQ